MLRRHFMRLCIQGLFLFSLCLSGVARAELRLELKTHSDSIIAGEPLVILTHVGNGGTAPIDVFYQNAPTYERDASSFVLLRVSGNEPPPFDHQQTVVRWFMKTWSDGFRLIERRIRATHQIESDEEAESELVMLYSRTSGLAFQEPGRYWISAAVVVSSGDGDSPPDFVAATEPASITVLDPQGEDQTAWKWLLEHKDEYGRLIQVPWSTELSEEFVDGCRELCAASDSVYVEYLALFLSRWYLEGAGNDLVEAAKYAEIAKTRASSDKLRALAERVAEAVAKERRKRKAAERNAPPAEEPVDPALRMEMEKVFLGYVDALRDGDIDRCLEVTTDDFRGWDRAKQREEMAEDVEEIKDLERKGIQIEISARVLSAVRIEAEVVITALFSIREGSKPPQRSTVRSRLVNSGDRWLLQTWDRQTLSE